MERENITHTEAPTAIQALSSRCISGFSRCVDSSHEGELEAIVDAQGRFNVWAANVGALQPPHSLKSLESRLKDAELMRRSVISGLERLAGVQIRSMQAFLPCLECVPDAYLKPFSSPNSYWKAAE
jgi:hypothetical protein